LIPVSRRWHRRPGIGHGPPTTKKTRASGITTPRGPNSVHQLTVDHSERDSALLDALRRSGYFDVQMDRLAAGDCLVNGEVLVERKTIRDLAARS
jgi:ERCC4-type nuclease